LTFASSNFSHFLPAFSSLPALSRGANVPDHLSSFFEKLNLPFLFSTSTWIAFASSNFRIDVSRQFFGSRV
jgi:hypothetical protein